MSERLSNLWHLVIKIYSDLNISCSNRIGDIVLESFTCPKRPRLEYPCLSGCKARHARYLLPVVVEIAELNVKDHPGPYTAHVMHAGKALLTMYSVMDKAGVRPTDIEKIDFREAVEILQMRCGTLAAQSQAAGEKQWDVVNKFHYSAHSHDYGDFFNIRFTSTYGGETNIGLVRIGTQVHRWNTCAQNG